MPRHRPRSSRQNVIEDAVGGGTTVRLQLPVAKQPAIPAIALGEAVS